MTSKIWKTNEKRICKWCEIEFTPIRRNQIACCRNHQHLYYRHKKTKRDKYQPKKCIYCGKIIEYTNKNKNSFSRMKTCGSEECMYKIRMAKLSDTISKEGREHVKKLRIVKNKCHRAWKTKQKYEIYELLGNKCKVCGYNLKEILEPHHIKGRDTDYRDNIMDLRKALKKGTLKKEFILLCPIHHRIRHSLKIPIKKLHKYKINTS